MAGLQRPKKAYLRNAEYYDCQTTFDQLYEQSKQNRCFKELMKYIVSEKNIRLAYRNIKKNHGSRTADADGKTIANLEKGETSELVKYVQKKFSYYQPQKIRRVEIPKANGKTRSFGIPTIMDRLI